VVVSLFVDIDLIVTGAAWIPPGKSAGVDNVTNEPAQPARVGPAL
jgi:hypothetical protein